MKTHLSAMFAAAAAIAVPDASLIAHHGAAAYELEHATELTATVTRFEWRNPHALLHFDVTRDDGIVEQWVAETAGPVILVRAGGTATCSSRATA